MQRPLFLFFIVLVLVGSIQALPLAPLYQIDTERFRVVYPEGYLEEAELLLAYAEDAREQIVESLGGFPDQRITIIMDDSTNAAATSYASNANSFNIYISLSTLAAFAPDDEGNQSYNVLAHELAHIALYAHVTSLYRLAEPVFGGSFAWFATTPKWFTEGISVNMETPSGEPFAARNRAEAPWERATLYALARENRIPAYDQTTGYFNSDWPYFYSPYYYGGSFLTYCRERYGDDILRRLLADYGDRLVPLFADSYRRTTGSALRDDWNAWRDELRADAEALENARAAEPHAEEPLRLTDDGAFKFGLEFCGGRLYSIATDSYGNDSGLLSIDPATGDRNFAPGFRGLLSGSRDGVLFYLGAQNESTPYSIFYDAYAYEPATRRSTRLTRDQRVSAFAYLEEGRYLCATNFALRAELFYSDGDNRTDIALPPDTLTVDAIAASPEGDGALIVLRARDGRTDFYRLDCGAGSVALRRASRDGRLKLYPSWLADGSIAYVTIDENLSLNLVAEANPDALGLAGERQATRLGEADGGVYSWTIANGRLYHIGVNADGMDLYETGLRSGRPFRVVPNETLSRAGALAPATGHEAPRRYIDEAYYGHIVRLPYLNPDFENLAATDFGINLRTSGLLYSRLNAILSYDFLHRHFGFDFGYATSQLWVPLNFQAQRQLEEASDGLSDVFTFTVGASYPFRLGYQSEWTFSAAAVAQSLATFDPVTGSGAAAWSLTTLQATKLELGTAYEPAETSALWVTRGATLGSMFGETFDLGAGGSVDSAWTTESLFLGLPLFTPAHGLAVRGRYAAPLAGTPTLTIDGGSAAYASEYSSNTYSLPFRGVIPETSPAGGAVLSVEARTTAFCSTRLSALLIPVNLNKAGLLVYFDRFIPFDSAFAPDWAAGTNALGALVCLEWGIGYQTIYLDTAIGVSYSPDTDRFTPVFYLEMR